MRKPAKKPTPKPTMTAKAMNLPTFLVIDRRTSFPNALAIDLPFKRVGGNRVGIHFDGCRTALAHMDHAVGN